MNCPPFISRLQQMQEYCKSRSVNNDKKALTSFDLPSESTEKMYAENYKILTISHNEEEGDLSPIDKCNLFRGDTFGHQIIDSKNQDLAYAHQNHIEKELEEIKAEVRNQESSLSSMPLKTEEFSDDFYVDASSCIHEGDEGAIRKPNVACKTVKVAVSDIRTANDSDIINPNNINNFDQHESFIINKEESFNSNSSWEVGEGSSIIIEDNHSSIREK